MVWIGRKKISRDVFHFSRWKLSWDNLTFELLDIIFSVTIDEREDKLYTKFLKNKNIKKSMEIKLINPYRAKYSQKDITQPKHWLLWKHFI